jgi:hypothetical protein
MPPGTAVRATLDLLGVALSRVEGPQRGQFSTSYPPLAPDPGTPKPAPRAAFEPAPPPAIRARNAGDRAERLTWPSRTRTRTVGGASPAVAWAKAGLVNVGEFAGRPGLLPATGSIALASPKSSNFESHVDERLPVGRQRDDSTPLVVRPGDRNQPIHAACLRVQKAQVREARKHQPPPVRQPDGAAAVAGDHAPRAGLQVQDDELGAQRVPAISQQPATVPVRALPPDHRGRSTIQISASSRRPL